MENIENELEKITPIASRYELAIKDIEGLREIVHSLSQVTPTAAFGAIVKNQARLIKTLPELQALSMRRYLDRFENAFTDSVMLAKNIVENNKCITYLKTTLRKAEERCRLIDRQANEDMALLKVNNKKQMNLLESRIEKLMRKEQVDMMQIVELKKEVDAIKEESETTIQSISKALKDIASYHQIHAQLLSSENQLIRSGSKDEETSTGVYQDFAIKFGHELRGSLVTLIDNLRETKESLETQSQAFELATQNARVIDQQERSLIKQEIDHFKRSLVNVRNILMADDKAVTDTIVDLRSFIDQLSRDSNNVAQTFERQVNRFVELNKINERKLRGM